MVKKIFIVAGEESGDQHGSALLQKVLALNPSLEISGLGGKHLTAMGMHNILDLTKLAITGLSGVLSNIFAIRRAFKVTKAYLLSNPPDMVILVDYPGFNLRLAKWIKKNLGCTIIYYISPQIWAWKAQRIEVIKACIDHMAVILHFETAIYEHANVPVTYVGHPLRQQILSIPNMLSCRQQFNWSKNDLILAILPGSRRGEISRHMPVIIAAIKLLSQKHPNLKIVIPVAKSLKMADFTQFLTDISVPYELVDGQSQHVVQAADAVIVASGTASLECALLAKPTCIIYKSSWLNYYLAMKLMKVNYLGLSNLLQKKMIIPELLQTDCTAKELSIMVDALLTDSPWRNSMIKNLQQLQHLLLPASGTPLEETIINFLYYY